MKLKISKQFLKEIYSNNHLNFNLKLFERSVALVCNKLRESHAVKTPGEKNFSMYFFSSENCIKRPKFDGKK